MTRDRLPWIELAIECKEGAVLVRPRGSGGEETKPRKLSWTLQEFGAFAATVGRQAEAHEPLDTATRFRAHALHADFFQGGVLELLAKYRERVKPEPLLVRLALADSELQAIPWEAMCEPGSQDAYLATSPSLRIVRKVHSAAAFVPREVTGSVRLLVLAATGAGVVGAIRSAVLEAVDSGALELLEPLFIEGSTADHLRRALVSSSGRDRSPHVLHIIGHGSASPEGTPILSLPGEAGDVRLSVESFAQDLEELFGDTLRLVVLDACRSAASGGAGSAAEILARSAAGAVIAHPGRVPMDVAAAFAKSFYSSLTRWEQNTGDVAASVHGARRELLRGDSVLPGGAGAFSPVVHLRGDSTALFDFPGYRKPRPATRTTDASSAKNMSRPLRALVGGRFSLLFGDEGEDPLEGQRALRKKIADGLGVPEDALPSLQEGNQRYALVIGRSELDEVFKEVLDELLEEDEAPSTPLAEAIAGMLRPGVHTTLQWLPVLEHALARRHSDKRIWVVQPPLPGGRSPRVRLRKAGEGKWSRQDKVPEDLRFDEDYVVLRPYGGYLPKKESTSVLLTEDDFIRHARPVEPPPWWNVLVRETQKWPALLVGVRALAWRHRWTMRLLLDRLPRGSVAVLPPGVDPLEARIWEEKGGGLTEEASRVDVVRAGALELPGLLHSAMVAEGPLT